MKLSGAGWCGLIVLALSTATAVAVGSEAVRVRQSLDDKPLIKTLTSDRLLRVSLDKKAQPLRAATPRRIVASLDGDRVAYVGSGTVKRRIRQTLDDGKTLGAAERSSSVATRRWFRQSLDDAPLAATTPRPLRTTLD